MATRQHRSNYLLMYDSCVIAVLLARTGKIGSFFVGDHSKATLPRHPKSITHCIHLFHMQSRIDWTDTKRCNQYRRNARRIVYVISFYMFAGEKRPSITGQMIRERQEFSPCQCHRCADSHLWNPWPVSFHRGKIYKTKLHRNVRSKFVS